MSELACYGLAGHSASPADLIAEAARAEELGLGSILLSERFALKDAAVMAGAAVAATRRIGVGTAATNHNTRHPLVTATMATTLHRMSGGRYAFGLGRGIPLLFDIMGLPHVTSAQLEDAIGLFRTLWSGEAVIGHDGSAGTYPYLMQDASFDEDIPVLLMAMGDNQLRLAGRIADGVVLHTFMSDAAVRRCVRLVRESAEQAGRDPAEVRIWSVMATIEDSLDETSRLRKLAGRLATYLTGYGDVLVRVNGWDPAGLEAFRADERLSSHAGALDATDDLDLLRHAREVLPDEWLATAAVGSAAHCADRIEGQLALGVDSVVLHGATPDELAPVLAEWRGRRDPGRFAHLDPNPGRIRPRSAPAHPASAHPDTGDRPDTDTGTRPHASARLRKDTPS
ncbi:TIGR03857 family LLM class F420-dependent oxidoreductase [Dietzia sp. B32]|uniref:TIGR03857 family LLM class F420-dependent oxidoreductase n=1 Tax=Dietzia sp. B32 TaxID=2915130 RepID=UPI0021AE09F1|nr:TIGR03857 family LLM class F420-dependent oxidoreductase [Dietzia sp. B32]UVE94433.1 TIGR03857 family LLM class F420-dependent oxidoreductase [Dietzia sp. B32]